MGVSVFDEVGGGGRDALVSMNDLRKRLEAIEERAFGIDSLADFSDWDLDEQLDDVNDKLRFYRAHHRDGHVRYSATDREIHLLALLCATRELPGGVGEYTFPSELVVVWREIADDGTCEVGASRWVCLEDLPADIGLPFKRMDPAKQPGRERFLYQGRHLWRKARECAAWHKERGWDELTLPHLRSWEKDPLGEDGR